MSYKSVLSQSANPELLVPLALAGMLAVAATAGPAAAQDVNTTPTFIPVPADTANVQPGVPVSISFRDPP
jgi:hypothetical protein